MIPAGRPFDTATHPSPACGRGTLTGIKAGGEGAC